MNRMRHVSYCYENAAHYLYESAILIVPRNHGAYDADILSSAEILAVRPENIAFLKEHGILISGVDTISTECMYSFWDLLYATVTMSSMVVGYSLNDAKDLGLLLQDELESMIEQIPEIEIDHRNLEQLVFDVISETRDISTGNAQDQRASLIATKLSIDIVNMSCRYARVMPHVKS